MKTLSKILCALILGDNLFNGSNLEDKLKLQIRNIKNTIFAFPVKDAQKYGVVEFDSNKKVTDIVEPENQRVDGSYRHILRQFSGE